jgi:hypothetical protein
MKMGSGIFWGVVLILIGLGLVIKIVFNIDFPIFKILIALLFIYIGIRIMVGGSFRCFGTHKTKNDIVFGESFFGKPDQDREYNVVFSKGTFDFRDIEFKDNVPLRVKINTVFGGAHVFINKDTPVRITIDAAFSGAHLPGGNSASFGTTVYTSDSLDTSKPFLDIKADVAFGGFIVQKF